MNFLISLSVRIGKSLVANSSNIGKLGIGPECLNCSKNFLTTRLIGFEVRNSRHSFLKGALYVKGQKKYSEFTKSPTSVVADLSGPFRHEIDGKTKREKVLVRI